MSKASLADIGRELARRMGNDFPAVENYVNAYDPELGSRAGAWYWSATFDSWASWPTQGAHDAWVKLAQVVNVQYHLLLGAGYTHTVTSEDPYSSPEELWADLDATGGIRTFASEPGGHPVWTPEENDRFRFVHDMLTHCAHRLPFTREGEDMAYLVHRATMPESVWPALAVETRAQNSALNFAEENGQPAGRFAPQLVVSPPAWLVG